MKKTNPLVVMGVAFGLLFLFLLIGQIVGSFVFFKHGSLINPSFTPFLLIKLWSITSGRIWDFSLAYKISAGISALLPFIFSILFSILIFKKPKRELHGSAKFANKIDLVKAKLLNPDKNPPDILIGKTMKGEYLRWSNKAFAYLAAPTRSGKGVGIVIPNCLHYRESLVVFDPKLENFKITSGYRKACGQEVYLFNPSTRDGKSHRWNPLSYVRRDRLYTVGDAFNIANIIYSTSSSGGEDNTKFFNEMAQKLFVGLVLYMIETEVQTGKTPTLSYLNQLTTPVGMDLSEWINEECVNSIHLSDVCKNNLLSYAQNSTNTASGILSSMIAPLSSFIEPIVAAATSGDDFDLREVRKKKMTIYIGISPNDFKKFERLINLFFSQLISVNTEELPEDNSDLKYQCLLLIDEFGAMGKVDVIQSGVAYIAGYNLRLLLIFQNLSQLNELYTADGARTLSTNFDCQIIYPPRDHKDAQEFSDIVGYETVKSTSHTKDRAGIGSKSESISDQKRALLLPQELTAMDDGECIISMRSMKPIHCKKIVYYEDPVFIERMNKPIPEVYDLGLIKQQDFEAQESTHRINGLTHYTIANCLPFYWSEKNRNKVAESILNDAKKDHVYSINDVLNEFFDTQTNN